MKEQPSKVDLRLIEAQASMRAEVWGDNPKLIYNHSVMTQVSMPFRNPGGDRAEYTRKCGRVTLEMEAGWIPGPDGQKVWVGLPYGPRARLVLLHLCTLAVLQQSRVVELEDGSFTSFAKSLGLATGGRDLASLAEQVRRMSVVNISLHAKTDLELDDFELHNVKIFKSLKATWTKGENQRLLWPSVVVFDHDFHQSLKTMAVPLRWDAVGALKHSARALDVYCWLAHRLWRTKRNNRITYKALMYQFGDPEGNQRSFQRAFDKALSQALLVYPEARVESVSGGIVVKPSEPAVPREKRKLFGL